ncbi:hypothetical protein NC651_039445 [Populus alba x Populus x berolinensis]|nr:hypothetical protein NC651_039445 [Populus alba x Populus x berolinensis]
MLGALPTLASPSRPLVESVSSKNSRSVPTIGRCMVATGDDDQIVRRSANYQTSMWDYDFVQSLTSKYKGEPYIARSEKLKANIRMMLANASKPLDQLELIDTLERLGLSYHFVDEIKSTLKSLFDENHIENTETVHDLYATALEFRLLRQRGYLVPQEVFNHFKDEQGNFKAWIHDDLKGMLNLYEASYFLVEGENILEDARDFTTKNLENYVKKCNTTEYLSQLVSHALELPLAWRMLRLEAHWFINLYETKTRALSYHGRKGLPIASRLALLDTRYLEYQHACIGSLETTLNCGTVVVMFYPNFNMALDDPQLHNFLKVQLHITGADQVQDTYQAILHYQMVYRVQNHAFDLVLPVTNDALLITIDTNQRATCTHVPRQIPKEDLQKLLPSSWIANYEKLHQSFVPIQSTEPEFTKKADGTVEIIFKKGESSTSPPRIFSSSISMVQPAPAPLPVPVATFSKDGCPVYAFSQDNHVFWDICSCESCCNKDLDADFPKHKRKSSGQKLKVRYNHGDRTIDTLG